MSKNSKIRTIVLYRKSKRISKIIFLSIMMVEDLRKKRKKLREMDGRGGKVVKGFVL